MQYIREIQENLEGHKNIKLYLEGDLFVITSDIQGLMYVGFHKFVGQEIIQGFNLTMDEWTEFLSVMERKVTAQHTSLHSTRTDTFKLHLHTGKRHNREGSLQLVWL